MASALNMVNRHFEHGRFGLGHSGCLDRPFFNGEKKTTHSILNIKNTIYVYILHNSFMFHTFSQAKLCN